MTPYSNLNFCNFSRTGTFTFIVNHHRSPPNASYDIVRRAKTFLTSLNRASLHSTTTGNYLDLKPQTKLYLSWRNLQSLPCVSTRNFLRHKFCNHFRLLGFLFKFFAPKSAVLRVSQRLTFFCKASMDILKDNLSSWSKYHDLRICVENTKI